MKPCTWVSLLVAALCGLSCASSAGSAEVRFTTPPTATRTPEGVKIEFAVSAATDVAIYVEDAAGNVVRHLAAGVLGPNAPAPLKANSLAQTLLWDGKDNAGLDRLSDQAGGGPFRVRIGLGLGAQFDRVLISDPQNLGGINSLAVGPDGTLYVTAGVGGTGPVWSGQIMLALDRDGKIVRQVMPFPAGLTTDQVAGFDVIELDGRPAPLVHQIHARSFYESTMPRKAGLAVTGNGVIVTLLAPCNLGAVGAGGEAPWGRYAGPSLQPDQRRPRFTTRPFVAISPDGRSAFVSGLLRVTLDERQRPVTHNLNAVYRVGLPDRSPAEVFFGDPETPGDDRAHLGGPPRGLAVDVKGRLLIADYANGRIVAVNASDGKFVAEFPVGPAPDTADPPAAGARPRPADAASGPDCIAADRKTGAVYVTRLAGGGAIELIKFAGSDDPRVLHRVRFPKSGNPDYPWLLALDDGGERPILWLGGDGGELLRIEDGPDGFSKPRDVTTSSIGNASFVDLSVDRVRDEIYARCGMYWWFRYNERTGELTRVQPGPYPGAAGSQLVAAPDGFLYSPAYSKFLLKFNRDGKPVDWRTGEPVSAPRANEPPHSIEHPVSMTFLTHTLGIRGDGQLFSFDPGKPGGRPPKMLVQIGPDGQRVGEPIIWKVSDTAVGPKFDAQGNIYIAEQIKPLDQPYPPEFAALVGQIKPKATYLEGLKDQVPSMYGSIVKFSPKGGMIHFDGPNPFSGEPKLDPSLTSVEAASYRSHRLHPTRVTGALWMRMGISHVDLIACNCENTRFDVDAFGRVFYPDLGRFRVGVLDTNGNAIAHFGRYGNADTADAIAFSWLIGVAVTDRYAYMGDSLNRRLLRARLTYAAEQTCPIP